MSHGHGKIERALLAVLREHERTASSLRDLARGLDSVELACRAYNVKRTKFFVVLNRAQSAAVRRALTALAREGLVIRLGMIGPDRRCYWRAAIMQRRPPRADT